MEDVKTAIDFLEGLVIGLAIATIVLRNDDQSWGAIFRRYLLIAIISMTVGGIGAAIKYVVLK